MLSGATFLHFPLPISLSSVLGLQQSSVYYTFYTINIPWRESLRAQKGADLRGLIRSMAMAARMALLSRGRAGRCLLGTLPKVQQIHVSLIGSGSLGSAPRHRSDLFFQSPQAASGLDQRVFSVAVRELLGQPRSFSVVASEKAAEPEAKSVQAVAAKEGHASEYWGDDEHPKLRADGSPWPWNCFRPADTYKADVSIDLKKHHNMDTFLDTLAFYTVKVLRIPTDIFPQKHYVYRVMMLETVAAVPGMVGGMLLHLRSLRKFEHSGGWIKALLEEAENERMHLMTWMDVKRPNWFARALVFIVQGGFFNTYFLMYILSPRLAHRVVGYLEEEAVYSYTKMLAAIDNGIIQNGPAPAIAIDYWRLPQNATIRDVVEVVRADEAHHRDVNHFAADVHEKGKVLRDAPAPVNFH